MKILHVIFSLKTGGAETMLVDIINEQAKTQIVELLIVNNLVNKELIGNINKEVVIHQLNRKPGSRNPFSILKFNYKVFKSNPTVIHFHNHNGINLLKFKIKAVTFLTVHDVNIPIVNFLKYKKIFSISNSVQDDVFTRTGIKPIKVYNGIRFEDVEINDDNGNFEKFKIVQVGRLDHEKKGQHILIKAIGILINIKGITNLQLDFIGDGESLKYLKKLAKELNLEEHLNFLGNKSREFIYKNLKNYHLLVQPSLFEGFGLTVVEGIAAKIPVLVADIDGPMELIQAGNYGYFFKSGEIEDCAKIILYLKKEYNSSQIVNRIESAYSYAKINFNINKTAEEYLTHYSEIL